MASTNGLPVPALTSANNPPADLLALANAVDATYGAKVSTWSSLPVSGSFYGQQIWVTDRLDYATWDGARWTSWSVSSASERDARYAAPIQGMVVWRNDLGATETYYGLYNASTNPGGRDAAGWYTNDRATGLMPVKAGTVQTSGSATVDALGGISFNGSFLALDGVFSNKYSNYKIIIRGNYSGSNADNVLYGRLRTAGGDNQSNYQNILALILNSTPYTMGGYGQTVFNLSRVYYTGQAFSAEITIQKPFTTQYTQLSGTGTGSNATAPGPTMFGGSHEVATAFDGINFIMSGGTITNGFAIVYGFND